MKKILISLIVVGCLVAGVITCPDKQKHHDVMMEELNTAVSSTIEDKVGGTFGKMLSGFGSKFASSVVERVLESSFSVDNYFVCSVGKLAIDDDVKTVSVGFLGHVFPIMDAEAMKEAVTKK